MKIGLKFSTLLLTISLLLSPTFCDGVCDLETLKLEIRQDLDDNNALDCLRTIPPPPDGKESDEKKNFRILAQWDTDCSFESSQDIKKLAKDLDIPNLVNSIGEEVDKDFEDQADICELVRAAVAANKFRIDNLDMQKLPNTWVDKLDCAGPSGFKGTTRICAASGGSPNQRDSWAIMVGPQNIKVY